MKAIAGEPFEFIRRASHLMQEVGVCEGVLDSPGYVKHGHPD